MNLYGIIKHLGVTEEKSLGLDTSNVTVENVPLMIGHKEGQRIKRVFLDQGD
jgi:KUP system potassium uptake protein